MVKVSYNSILLFISVCWLLVRAAVWMKKGKIEIKREAQLMLVYICIAVVARFTFCPFGKVDGQIQPLLFDATKILPFRLNLIPLVKLFDYPEKREALLNFIGNTAMFIPVGIVWPAVFRELDTALKAFAAGLGFSLCIEILQLPFFDRVTDVDDLLLNALGYMVGYGIYRLCKKCRRV